MANLQRSVQLSFRVSAEERRMIENKMALLGITSTNAYLRKMAIDGYAINLDIPELREMISLLRRSSANLNQLAKRVNATGHFYDADLEDLQQGYDKLRDAAGAILNTLSKLQ